MRVVLILAGAAFFIATGAIARDVRPSLLCTLDEPRDVASTISAGEGLVFLAADAANNRVQIHSTGAGTCNALPLTGADSPGGSFDGPRGVAVGADERIYVSDTGNDRVLRFDDLDGLDTTDPVPFIDVFVSEGLQAPEGLGTDDVGRLYVADTGNDRVVVVTADGIVADVLGPELDDETEFSEPVDVAVCPGSAPDPYAGRIFVADRADDAIYAFGPDGTYLFAIGGPGSIVGLFDQPSSISTDSLCLVYVADTSNNRVQVFTPDGGFLETFDVGGIPSGIAVEDGNIGDSQGVFVASRQANRVVRYAYVDYDIDDDGDYDDDRDALPDLWETDGIDIGFDGTVDLDLPSMGADPHRKDIFLEIDHMESRDVFPSAAAELVAAFADAPVDNPDGSTGITLHIAAPSDEIDFAEVFFDDQFTEIKANNLGSVEDRAVDNADEILTAIGMTHHYAIIANTRCGDVDPNNPRVCIEVSTNVGSSYRGPNFIVTLASASTAEKQASTLMHEIGHNFGLNHGGRDGQNCKPNYLSVMNYMLPFIIAIDGDHRIDYSRERLDDLNENALDENTGVNNGCDLRTRWSADGGTLVNFGTACGALDWNGDGNLAANVSTDLTTVTDLDGCSDETKTVLRGHDDWSNLRLNFRRNIGFGLGTPISVDPAIVEISREDLDEVIRCNETGICGRPPYEYAAKIVCGVIDEDALRFNLPGHYATSVNIHNPSEEDTPFFIKFAVTIPPKDGEPGAIAKIGDRRLAYNEALAMTCPVLVDTVFGDQERPDFVEGMLIIQSAGSLDVRAVYTAGPLAAKQDRGQYDAAPNVYEPPIGVRSINIVDVPERVLKAKEDDNRSPSGNLQPDLLPVDLMRGEANVTANGPFCRFRSDSNRSVLVVKVMNRGADGTGPTTTRLKFGNGAQQEAVTPALEPGESVLLNVPTPAEWLGNAARAVFTIIADVNNVEPEELDEKNNEIAAECVFPG